MSSLVKVYINNDFGLQSCFNRGTKSSIESEIISRKAKVVIAPTAPGHGKTVPMALLSASKATN